MNPTDTPAESDDGEPGVEYKEDIPDSQDYGPSEPDNTGFWGYCPKHGKYAGDGECPEQPPHDDWIIFR